MKLHRRKKIIFVLLCANTLFVLLLYYFISVRGSVSEFPQSVKYSWNLDIEELIVSHLTFVLREFEYFDNDVVNTISHLRKLIPNCKIVVITDTVPYPPIDFKRSNVNHHVLELNPENSYLDYSPSSVISTEYVIFIPDGARISGTLELWNALQQFRMAKFVRAFAIKADTEELTCPGIQFNLRKWSLTLTEFEGTEGMCDSVQGVQAILMKSKHLQELSLPFQTPLAKSLYIQFVFKRWKTMVYDTETVFKKRIEFKDPHSAWKHKHLEESKWRTLLHKLQIKHVHHILDIDKKKDFYYGCTKNTERCFGTVINNVPDFIVRGRWTPPCCLKALRETAQHVFKILESVSVRYWLEGGSLLGAARHGNIIPWDYDVDIGIYLQDVKKVKGLVEAKKSSYVDDGGFVWEKAKEGDFYKVRYSEMNRNHIDIFPFFSRNGTMTKNTWIKTHRQDTEFPEHFLKPLTHISFIGVNVSAPNNVKEFLEFKFGKGVIENPKYPDDKNVH